MRKTGLWEVTKFKNEEFNFHLNAKYKRASLVATPNQQVEALQNQAVAFCGICYGQYYKNKRYNKRICKTFLGGSGAVLANIKTLLSRDVFPRPSRQ